MTAEEHLTSPGTALGTVAYMSPEQALGQELDARTDLFSLGVVLYEMATGQQAFSGSSTAAIFDGILPKAPTSPVRLDPELPARLEEIINKALEKDRDLRCQSAAELRADLKRLKRDTTSGRSVAAGSGVVTAAQPQPVSGATPALISETARRPASKRWVWLGLAALVIMAAAAVGVVLSRRAIQHVGPLKVTPFTSTSGRKADPAFSPDGNELAFGWYGKDNHYHIYVKLIGAGTPLQLTSAPGDDSNPVWSPDGKSLYIVRNDEGHAGLWKMPIEGGPEAQLVPNLHYLIVGFWPEGICYLDADKSPAEVQQMDFATDRARRVGTVDIGNLTNFVFGISVPPDGKQLLYSRLDHAESNVVLVENFR